jgi:hypothetical protein
MILLQKEMPSGAIAEMRSALSVQRIRALRLDLISASGQNPGEMCNISIIKPFVIEAIKNAERNPKLQVDKLQEFMEYHQIW